MKLYAISDLHLSHRRNREALARLSFHTRDWLLLAGDVCESEEDFRLALATLSRRFAKVFWTPGNHELWTVPSDPEQLRGEAKYQRFVSICRAFGVHTPEDPYVRWPGPVPCLIAPLFLLYDYSFRPDDVSEEQAVAWAEETRVVCTDEYVLHPDPFPSRSAWCAERCAYTERRLEALALDPATPLLLVNHYPLSESLVRLPNIPRFSLWCGTRRTRDWHTRFPVAAVVYGHLHLRSTDLVDGVRFEEASFGYPRDWDEALGMEGYLREILPDSRAAANPDLDL